MTATEDANKALVIEAFDTLFNRRDYVRAEAFWSPDYIQHSAHIAPGRASGIPRAATWPWPLPSPLATKACRCPHASR
jgi:hypothetical protein